MIAPITTRLPPNAVFQASGSPRKSAANTSTIARLVLFTDATTEIFLLLKNQTAPEILTPCL